jgi:diguanylate cyclase (GGDEF)-like protein
MDGISFVLSGKTLLIIIVILAILCLILLATTFKLLLLYKDAKKDSIIDPLTRLFNNREYERERLEQEIELAKRYSHDLQVVFIDLDNFKRVNDVCGHKKGDEILRIVAKGIRKIIRRYDIAVRHGGDEFVLIIPRASIEETEALCRRIIKMIENVEISDSIKISASIGVRSFDSKNPDVDLIKSADYHMYLAKNNGKGKISIHL